MTCFTCAKKNCIGECEPSISAGPITPEMVKGPTPEQKAQMVEAMSKLAEKPAQPNWSGIGRLIEAANHASAHGFVSGTSNWAASVLLYMAKQPAQQGLGLDADCIASVVANRTAPSQPAQMVSEGRAIKLAMAEENDKRLEAQQQEPVAVYIGETWCGSVVSLYEDLPLETPLYKSPPASKPLPEDYTALEQALTRLQKRYADLEGKASRLWVGLTNEEISEVLEGDIHDEPSGLLVFVRAIEAKLKEKNNHAHVHVP